MTMTTILDDAIKYHEEMAIDNESMCEYNLGCSDSQYKEWRKCAKEHRQLAEWLKKLKDYEDRQDLINKIWKELIMYKEGIEKIKMRSQSYRERGETVLASGMEQALDILQEVNADVI